MNRSGTRSNKFTRPMPEPVPVPKRSQYVGECRGGGPYDGQQLAHYEKEKPFFSAFTPFFSAHDRVVPVEIGRYVYNEAGGVGLWMWHETDAGRALETLNSEVA